MGVGTGCSIEALFCFGGCVQCRDAGEFKGFICVSVKSFVKETIYIAYYKHCSVDL